MVDNSFTLPDGVADRAHRRAELLGRKPDHIVTQAVIAYDNLLEETWKGHRILIEDSRTGAMYEITLRDGAPPVHLRPTFEKWVQDRPALLFLLTIWMWTAIVSGITMFALLATGKRFDGFWGPIQLLSYVSYGLSLVFAGTAHFSTKWSTKKAKQKQEE